MNDAHFKSVINTVGSFILGVVTSVLVMIVVIDNTPHKRYVHTTSNSKNDFVRIPPLPYTIPIDTDIHIDTSDAELIETVPSYNDLELQQEIFFRALDDDSESRLMTYLTDERNMRYGSAELLIMKVKAKLRKLSNPESIPLLYEND